MNVAKKIKNKREKKVYFDTRNLPWLQRKYNIWECIRKKAKDNPEPLQRLLPIPGNHRPRDIELEEYNELHTLFISLTEIAFTSQTATIEKKDTKKRKEK